MSFNLYHIYYINIQKKRHADDVEVLKTHKNTCIKHDMLGFKGLNDEPVFPQIASPLWQSERKVNYDLVLLNHI